MNKKKLLLILLLVCIALVFWWYLNPSKLVNNKREVTLYGQIDLRTVQLSFSEQEYIEQMYVDEGDVVKGGQVLAVLKKDRLAAQLQEAISRVEAQEEVVQRLTTGLRPQEVLQARAKVQAAEIQLKNAQALLRRVKTTTPSGASTRQSLDDAVTSVKLAQAELAIEKNGLSLAEEGYRKEDIAEAKATLKGLKASVDLLWVRMGELKLVAPVNGIIQNRIAELGELASPSRVAFTLAVTEPKWVRAYLPEPELGLVMEGMRASVYSDSFAEPFKGWVGFISPQAEFTPKRVETTELRTQLVYEVRVWVDDPDNRLKLGMPVTIALDTSSSVIPDADPKPDNGSRSQ
ncbi:efflux RND transporter periplasmic adaptor subunit [Halodesulfovibrio marinisediminis]|uniref:HlyD family secretion protein n=1 Tax=Halodesulfovibrio marinisediminis DSM 17456 TaxID=1121457 RepID=A0A1N6JA16_9BACT|nr:efflux RND transporter periplasmic adaptor subunit [Halodesulfovibrio marinisediminis]SIO41122.1 HlyD family secretion protein [Halodesulfovibrio marinisediminis DSM 17456]